MTIPAKLQSYMACGCPIIGAVDGESKRIIEESGCGLTSEIGNPSDLAEKIELFSGISEEKRSMMSAAAVDYCKQNFNKKNLIDYFENIIKIGSFC